MGKKYLSETLQFGSRTYLVEVKEYSRDARKQKYMIITQAGLPPDDQKPVIVFEWQMGMFLDSMNRASAALWNEVSEVRLTTDRKPGRKKKKANPPEFGNSGKRWTQADDQLLAEKFQNGESMESLMSTFKRRTKAIEVRLFKLGLLPTSE